MALTVELVLDILFDRQRFFLGFSQRHLNDSVFTVDDVDAVELMRFAGEHRRVEH